MFGSTDIPEHDNGWLDRALILFGILAALSPMHATAQSAVVSDSTFQDANWTLTQFCSDSATCAESADRYSRSQPISRVLLRRLRAMAVIPLGASLPMRSCHLPAD